MTIFLTPALAALFTAHPLTLVDIGARGGLQPNWRAASEHLRVVGFEPDPAEYARLKAAADPQRFVYINAAVHRARGDLTLNVGREGGTSSIHPPNPAFLNRFPDPERYAVEKQVTIPADSLDALLAANGIAAADFIKIDTQGAEHAILQGATRTLAGPVFGLEVEVLFGALYEGQSRFGDTDGLLMDAGFQLMDLRHSYWKRAKGARHGGPKGQLAFGDALYFKTEEAFQQLLGADADDEARRTRLAHALAMALLYGYRDYAIELFEPNRALFDAATATAIDGALRSHVAWSTRIPYFPGRGRLSHFFYRLHRLFYPTLGGWASGGRTLGNVD
jgi:FkbM family methyltransferase